MSVRVRRALEDAAGQLFAVSQHMPTDWQRAKVREWADKAGKVAFASADGRPKGRDREHWLGSARNDQRGSEGRRP